MKMLRLLPLLLLLTLGLRAQSSYQVTGPIVALTDSVITVQKGDEKFEIARSSTTKTDGKLAVGNRVTVYYKMSADRIEVKEGAGKSSDKPAKKGKKSS